MFHGYLDPNADSRVDGLQYEGNIIGNCSVQLIEFKQFLWAPVDDQVITATPETYVQEWIACNLPHPNVSNFQLRALLERRSKIHIPRDWVHLSRYQVGLTIVICNSEFLNSFLMAYTDFML